MAEEKRPWRGRIRLTGAPSPWPEKRPPPVRKLDAMRIRVVSRSAETAKPAETRAAPRSFAREMTPLGIVAESAETVEMTGDADIDLVRRQLIRARGELSRVQDQNRQIVDKVREVHTLLEGKFGKIDGEAFRKNLDPDSIPGEEGRKFRKLLAELEEIGGDDAIYRTTRSMGRHMGRML